MLKLYSTHKINNLYHISCNPYTYKNPENGPSSPEKNQLLRKIEAKEAIFFRKCIF